MRAQDMTEAPDSFLPVTENATGAGPLLLACEDASNAFLPQWDDLGLNPDQARAHIAGNQGALGLAHGLAERLHATLTHAPVSGLIYDLNRGPDMAGAMRSRSEVHDIPGNAALTRAQPLARTHAVYLPWAYGLRSLICSRIASGRRSVVISIHSFTPVHHGKPRAVEFGLIHDADPTLAHNINAACGPTGLKARLNEPCSAAEDVTHTLLLHATPYGLANATLEIRNDLIAAPQTEVAMADRLAPVLQVALAAKDIAA